MPRRSGFGDFIFFGSYSVCFTCLFRPLGRGTFSLRGTVSLACAPHTLYHCSGFQFRPEGRVHFLCSAKENEPKERRTRRLAPRHTCRGVPCAPRKNRRAPNSPISLRSLRARTWGALLELQARLAVLPAVLGCTDGANPLYPTSRWRSRASQGFWDRVSPPV